MGRRRGSHWAPHDPEDDAVGPQHPSPTPECPAVQRAILGGLRRFASMGVMAGGAWGARHGSPRAAGAAAHVERVTMGTGRPRFRVAHARVCLVAGPPPRRSPPSDGQRDPGSPVPPPPAPPAPCPAARPAHPGLTHPLQPPPAPWRGRTPDGRRARGPEETAPGTARGDALGGPDSIGSSLTLPPP